MKNFYRKAIFDDLKQVMEAVEDSREVLRLQGNGQWQDGYPNQDDYINDINNGRLFVVLDENDDSKIAGVCALTYREEDYHHLYEGKWLTDLPYMVMHRVALKKEYRNQGYGKKLFKVFIEQAKIEGYYSLRIDTHEGNSVMRHLIASFGFVFCGRAILTPDKDRMVFERVLSEEEMPHLILPTARYLDSYNEAREENDLYSPEAERIFTDNPDPINYLEEKRLGINLKPGYVPATTLWLVDNEMFIGEIHIRHQLTQALLNYGGTIGYGIRYCKRHHGYGKLMLKLALIYCKKELNLRKVMITCNEDNYASEKVMLANGGIFTELLPCEENSVSINIKKYWINVEPHIIDCDRFFLREYQESDRQALSDIYQDAENMVYFGAPYDDKMMNRLMSWTFDNYKKYGFGFWAIIDKKTGAFIGDCGLSMQNIDGEWLPEIGYHINKKYHNMHYATEAARLVKDYIFKNYIFDALYGYTVKENIGSIKVMLNNGMSFVKEFDKDGEHYVVYSVKRYL